MDGERTVPVHQHLRHLLQGGRPGQRDQAVDRQEAGIAEGGRIAGLGAVEQGDLVAGALQGAGGGGAHDAGADDDDRAARDGIVRLFAHGADVSTTPARARGGD